MSFIKRLVEDTRRAINEGYYDLSLRLYHTSHRLSDAILASKHAAIIGEIKFASPSMGKIREYSDPVKIARDIISADAIGLSILTNRLFNGRLDYLLNVRIATDIPILMKDIVIDNKQIDAAYKSGADCILVISSIFDDKHVMRELIDYAHSYHLEVLLEVHDKEELKDALESNADLIGINNRDLNSMKIDLSTTENLLRDISSDKIIVSESGIESSQDIVRLYKAGARAFLVGTSIMKSNNIRLKLKELVKAI
ncbi:MAG: indole-3-glycerol-phosphate synthase [Candidatus Nitrosocaldaceae archaeon]